MLQLSLWMTSSKTKLASSTSHLSHTRSKRKTKYESFLKQKARQMNMIKIFQFSLMSHFLHQHTTHFLGGAEAGPTQRASRRTQMMWSRTWGSAIFVDRFWEGFCSVGENNLKSHRQAQCSLKEDWVHKLQYAKCPNASFASLSQHFGQSLRKNSLQLPAF